MHPGPGVDSKQLLERLFEELWQHGRFAAADELVTPDYLAAAPGMRDLSGPDGIRQLVTAYRSGFPDLVVTIDNQLAQGDNVVTEFSMQGRHTGNWTGVRATGREISLRGCAFSRVADGRIARQWYEWDRRRILEQLKVMPGA
jgi:steroid delta-isomerase-like uncharacterized protein